MQANNKRIAKNTLFLYFRMMLVMAVSLLTTRVVFKALGEVDYGLYNVVAGVITLFSFLNSSLGAATSRFLTFEMGLSADVGRLKKVFSTAFHIHAGLALIVVLLCETLGVWMVNHVLVIPPERLFACHLVFQFVIFNAVLSITQVPMYASIIAHEMMQLYAYIGIVDVVLKLLIAYLIMVSSADKLILYVGLQSLAMFGIYLFYHIFCRKKCSEYSIGCRIDKKLFRDMTSYSVWSLFGSTVAMSRSTGVNILLNIFFGPVVNAANAIAYQVNNALTQFYTNFTLALSPQIIKSYASNEIPRMKSLIFRGGKFSFYLLMIAAIPFLVETDFVLSLWLGEVPEYTCIFTKLVILFSLTDCFTATAGIAVQATGNIKLYQLVVGGIQLLAFPIIYTSYDAGAGHTAALYITIATSFLAIFVRLLFLKKYFCISPVEYMQHVLLIAAIVFLCSIICPLCIHYYMDSGIRRFIIVTTVSIISSIIVVYFVGLSDRERQWFITVMKRKTHSTINLLITK